MMGEGVPLPWSFDPLEALRRWPDDRPVLLLHSGRLHPRWSRWSILAEPTGAYRFQVGADGGGVSRWIGDPAHGPSVVWSHRPFCDMRRVLADRSAIWIGYLGYDLARFIEKLPTRARADRDWPAIQLHRCSGWAVHDAVNRHWCAAGTWAQGGAPALHDREGHVGPFTATDPVSGVSREAFEAAVARAIEYVGAGDVFQVNLAQRFTAGFRGHPRTLFDRLARQSPAWYGAHLEMMGDGPDEPRRTISSTSPELFLQLDTDGVVTTRPVKGTRPAAADPAELNESVKDLAELNMIVDLLRNDLGRVCSYGTVRVAQARCIESHPTVHHGVATVTGSLYRTRKMIDLLRATMPGGSVTGAPKVRAMQIIDELEPVRRGPYCGAIGFVHGGTACFSIAIRTMLLEQTPDGRGRLDFSVGGGIIADSDPAAEYQETLDKAAAMIGALRG